MQTDVFHLSRGSLPLLVSIPHVGMALPEDARAGLSPAAFQLQDADWHLDRLYAFAHGLGASVLSARISRYVIDLNRPPGGESLYPGQTTTGLCPTETFRGEALYAAGRLPSEAVVRQRLAAYWTPYHAALRAELDRLLAAHGQVLLWDAHSIAGTLPRLFDGQLPDLNFGTNDARSCSPHIARAAIDTVSRSALPFSHVLNGRFKGGYITRHYGNPLAGVHAIQLEMCQHLYMNEAPPFDYRPRDAARIQSLLPGILTAAMAQLRQDDRRVG